MRRAKRPYGLFITSLAIALLAAPVALHAQVRSSTIHITVTDSGGSRVPNAAAAVTEETTNQQFATETNTVGEATVPYLAAGRYTVTIRKEGFNTYRQSGLELSNNQSLAVEAVLAVGATAQAIEVSAAAVQLQTESTTVQSAIDTKLLGALPNINSNPMYYAALQATVVPAKASFANSTNVNAFGIGYTSRQAFSSLSINGGETLATDLLLDGVPINDPAYNSAAIMPNPEGIQEVRVLSNNFSADNGRGQGVMSIITKSGTNQFHGSAGYRLRNEALNANTFSNNYNRIARPAFKSSYWDGAVGGPVIKDKLFFFTSYEGMTHKVGAFWLTRVPTAAEKKGDFSRTLIPDENGQPVPVQLFDPFSVRQVGPNLYQRAAIPNSIIPNPNKNALKLFSYYPDSNRTPIDVYNNQNYLSTGTQDYGKLGLNARIDYRHGLRHSIYAAGGISRGSISIGSPWGGDNPFYFTSNVGGAQDISDHNPYFSLGDTIVLSPSLVLDVRAGMTRIESNSSAKSVDFNFDEVGVPASVQSVMPDSSKAPDFCPGSGMSCLGSTTWSHKQMRMTTGVFTGSVTKTHGHWTFKAGAEHRTGQANYKDFAEGSVAISTVGGMAEYLTANGGGVPQNQRIVQGGYQAANLLMGAGTFSVTPGFGVRPSLSTRYSSLYSQNDWRVTSKLTVNLGLRWELQPSPTERFNRISSYDDSAVSAFGYPGAIVFPGVGEYDRHLWKTSYADFGPRLGAAYSLDPSTVLRGGYGITYLPSNTGYAPGPSRYGTSPFSGSVNAMMYGTGTPNGELAGTYDSGATAQVVPLVGANPNDPRLYGASSGFARFSHNGYKSGRVQQFNFAVEKRFGNNWFLSATYTGTRGSRMPNKLPLTSTQFVPASDLAAWRAFYIANNGQNPAQDTLPNPLQPASGGLIPFSGSLAGRTLTRLQLEQGNLLFPGNSQSISNGNSRYNAAIFRVNHAFASGLTLDAHYTWSKSMADYASDMMTNGGTDTGVDAISNNGRDYLNQDNNWHLGFVDTPHRMVASFAYELPFGRDGRFRLQNAVARALAGGWRIGGTQLVQSGQPLVVYGMTGSGSLNGRPDRVPGVAVELPDSYQRFYDGRTEVTLPSGRKFTPCSNCFLKYNPDAFAGRTVALQSRTAADPYWWGTAAITYDDIRGPGRFNTDLRISRSFQVTETKQLQFSADLMNALNHTQFSASGNLSTGEVNTTDYPGKINNLNQLGGHGLATYDPRQIELKLRFIF